MGLSRQGYWSELPCPPPILLLFKDNVKKRRSHTQVPSPAPCHLSPANSAVLPCPLLTCGFCMHIPPHPQHFSGSGSWSPVWAHPLALASLLLLSTLLAVSQYWEMAYLEKEWKLWACALLPFGWYGVIAFIISQQIQVISPKFWELF